MLVQRNKLFHFVLCVLMGIISYLIMIELPNDYTGVVATTYIQLVVFIIGYISLSRITKSLFSLYGIFLIVFYFFQNGQVLLYSLGLEYDYFYVEKYEVSTLFQSIIFSTICLCSAFAAGVFSTSKNDKASPFYSRLNSIKAEVVVSSAKLYWWVFAIVAIPYMLLKFVITSVSGYYAMMSFLSTLPSIFNLAEKLFVGMSVLLLVYCDEKTKIYKCLIVVMIVWSLLAALTGDRTLGLAGLITIALIRFTIGNRDGKKKTISKYLMFGLSGIAVIYLVSIAFSYRMQSNESVGGLGNAIIGAIGTLGFSFFPLVLVMRVYPNVETFMWGKSILGGFVAGIIPNNIDFLGVTRIFEEWSSAGTKLIDTHYRYGFGLDFSLNAECYINFGWQGWIAMFFLCCIIASFLKQLNFMRFDNLFSQYSALILLFCWFTLPRRKCYYIFNHFFWYVLAVGVLILLLGNILSRKSYGKRK